jgi:anaerobic ribonucleoside-triphosphate reductase
MLKYIHKNKTPKFEDDKDLLLTISDLCNFFYNFKQFYSRDLVLGDFHNHFIGNLDLSEEKSYIMDFLVSQILRFEESCKDNYPHLTLGFNNYESSNLPKINSLKQFFNSLMKKSRAVKIPFILLNYSDFISNGTSEDLINKIFSHPIKDKIILQNSLLNSAIIKIPNPKNNKVILDKILINLHMVSIDANQNDDIFFEILQEKIESAFKFFQIKKELVRKKLSNVKQWNMMIPHLFEANKHGLLDNSIKSISFFGLNKGILNHCGIELDRTESSTSFALNVLSFIRKLTQEKNDSDNEFYTITQPHNGSYLFDCFSNDISEHRNNDKFYSSQIIRDTSSLPLIKKISLFKKFEKLMNGGSIFAQNIDGKHINLEEFLQMLIESEINAFSLGNFENGVI